MSGMSRSASSARIGVVAHPRGRRWLGFSDAARRLGLEPSCLGWVDALRAGRIDPEATSAVDLVRIDSPSEDADVDALLCGRTREPGEVLGAEAWTSGMLAVARTLGDAASRTTPHPRDLRDLMDKARCHARLGRAGVPVAPALPAGVAGWAALRAATRDAGWTRVFVKPTFGSSGSGVLALAMFGSRVRATGHLDVIPMPEGVRLYNRLRPVVFDDEAVVAAVVDALAPEGLHVERWTPKVVTAGGAVDLRVVCVAGRATHVAARVGNGPVTNLHAGGRRLDLDAARDAMGAGFDEAVTAAERAAACFPRSLQLGVDVGVLADRRTAVVFEANAFGDLLPGTEDIHGRHRSTWDEQAVAIAGGWRPGHDRAAA